MTNRHRKNLDFVDYFLGKEGVPIFTIYWGREIVPNSLFSLFFSESFPKGSSHSKKKCKISHWAGGGGQDKTGSFSPFF